MTTEIAATPRFVGDKIWMDGRDWTVPGLSVRQGRENWPSILELNKGITAAELPARRDEILRIIHTAMVRNYPELKLEELEDMVDLKTLLKLLGIVCGRSGLEVVPGEKPAAEAGAASQ